MFSFNDQNDVVGCKGTNAPDQALNILATAGATSYDTYDTQLPNGDPEWPSTPLRFPGPSISDSIAWLDENIPWDSTDANRGPDLLAQTPGLTGTTQTNLDDSENTLLINGDPSFPTTSLTSPESLIPVSTNVFGGCVNSRPPYETDTQPGWRISQTPVHLPTVLIEHWFSYVCPMWSVFDSEVNYNRQLAREAWTVSETVFYAMQAMSAACLIDHMPQLTEVLPSLKAKATAAVHHRIAQAQNSVTSDLVFAVLALGTSFRWNTAPTTSQDQWVELARRLLSAWKVQPSTPDALFHAYFCQALTYWDMLLAVTGQGVIPAKIERKKRQCEHRIRGALHLPNRNLANIPEDPPPSSSAQNIFGTRPHSWCGVSKEVIDVFAQVLALCLDAYRSGEDKQPPDLTRTSNALCNISLAHELQTALLAMDFGTIVSAEEAQGFPVQTQDKDTPMSHLLQTAEAYRQAALLQLHLSFHDLPSPNGTPCDNTTNSVETGSSQAEALIVRALHLVSILEKIPIESRSTSIHPMLYLSAAAGLRFTLHPAIQQSGLQEPGAAVSGREPSPLQMQPPSDITTQPALVSSRNPFQQAPNSAHISSLFILSSVLEVSKARRLVWTRLSTLHQAMPQRVGDGALRLVKDIWYEYDTSSSRSCPNWLGIFTKTGPETIFR